MKLLKSFCLLIIACIGISCMKGKTYYASEPLPKEGWAQHDTLVLKINLTDSLPVNAAFSFLLRHRINYPYTTFEAKIIFNAPDTTRWDTRSIRLKLAEADGTWIGKGWGNLYEHVGKIEEFAVVPPAAYTFKIVHQMDDVPSLKGIVDVGIMANTDCR